MSLAALRDELLGPGSDVALGGSAVSPQHRDQLHLHLVGVGGDIGGRDRPPVLAIDAAVDDEAETELGGVEAGRDQERMRVVHVAARATSEECRQLPGGQLVQVQHANRGRAQRADRVAVLHRAGPQRRAQHEVDVQLEVARGALRAEVSQPPLAAGVVGRDPLDGQPLARAHGLHRLIDLRLLGQHRLALDGSEVVQVDVHREAGHLEVKQVQRRAALERDPGLQERVAAERVEQRHQPEDLLQRLRAKARRRDLLRHRLRSQVHVTSAHLRLRTRSGTTRFQRERSLPDSRFPRSRYIGRRGARSHNRSRCWSSTISASRCCSR